MFGLGFGRLLTTRLPPSLTSFAPEIAAQRAAPVTSKRYMTCVFRSLFEGRTCRFPFITESESGLSRPRLP